MARTRRMTRNTSPSLPRNRSPRRLACEHGSSCSRRADAGSPPGRAIGGRRRSKSGRAARRVWFAASPAALGGDARPDASAGTSSRRPPDRPSTRSHDSPAGSDSDRAADRRHHDHAGGADRGAGLDRAIPQSIGLRLLRRGRCRNGTSTLGARHLLDRDQKLINWNLKKLGPVDVLIDLLPHSSAEQRALFNRLFWHLKPRGVYVVDPATSRHGSVQPGQRRLDVRVVEGWRRGGTRHRPRRPTREFGRQGRRQPGSDHRREADPRTTSRCATPRPTGSCRSGRSRCGSTSSSRCQPERSPVAAG